MANVFLKDCKKTPKGAVFLSGSGTNAEKLLEKVFQNKSASHTSWEPAVLVTDRPKTSRAREIASKYDLPLVECGILDFYRSRGLEKVTLATEKARQVREEWTDLLREKISPYHIDFGLLAGFVPLCNIVEDFPCLNVHPADLTQEENGVRKFAGLHSVGVELAMLYGGGFLRSSVILVKPFSGSGGGMDSGHILGVSGKVATIYDGYSVEELQKIFEERTGPHIHGLHKDLLFFLAEKNQANLKEKGDHILYPPVVDDFAAGCFAEDETDGSLLYRKDPASSFMKVKTVEYTSSGSTPLF
ncbi:MAG: hypothetical protein J6S53_06325 [Lentisphaeria bacterium]|nr:hypothetical protein [Lentisphaeria bacterium]